MLFGITEWEANEAKRMMGKTLESAETIGDGDRIWRFTDGSFTKPIHYSEIYKYKKTLFQQKFPNASMKCTDDGCYAEIDGVLMRISSDPETLYEPVGSGKVAFKALPATLSTKTAAAKAPPIEAPSTPSFLDTIKNTVLSVAAESPLPVAAAVPAKPLSAPPPIIPAKVQQAIASEGKDGSLLPGILAAIGVAGAAVGTALAIRKSKQDDKKPKSRVPKNVPANILAATAPQSSSGAGTGIAIAVGAVVLGLGAVYFFSKKKGRR